VRRLKGVEGGELPGKLRNPWQGPFRMIRWNGDRNCIVDHDGTEKEYNVNRLTKQYEWDARHPDTSGVMAEREASQTAKKLVVKKFATRPLQFPQVVKENGTPRVGQVIIFHKAITSGHRSPFGVGVLLEIRANGELHFQWLGNSYYNANGTFQKGWMNISEDLGYYGRKISRLDVPWTGDHTEEPVTPAMLIAWGDDLLSKEQKLSAKARKAITLQVGAQNTWKQAAFWKETQE
jgi:hypothetical protein